jgi:L-threonylcarbamoyladenylate synthase
METTILPATSDQAVSQAVRFLRTRQLVALPTETVYGLAGNALDPMAVGLIFATKDRPFFDPLIVHLGSKDWVRLYAETPASIVELLDRLTTRFWPGPLTILLPKKGIVPDVVTAGLPSVALRVPSHRTFQKVIEAFGGPLAAPSANRFGRVSPTTAAHVFSELESRIPLIVDAGPTHLGLESTIIRLVHGTIELLRPGPITREDLEKFGSVANRSDSTAVEAPGQTAKHYSPEKPLRILRSQGSGPTEQGRVGLICWGPSEKKQGYVLVRSLSETWDLLEAGAKLFATLREMDRADLDAIDVEPVPERGLGVAIMNRLRRAAFDGGKRPAEL